MAYVVKNLCVGCGKCALYCPVQAIAIDEVAFVDQDKCVECGTCVRAECPVDALRQPRLKPPRLLRRLFSDPLTQFEEPGVVDRGSGGMKTNDVTNRVGFGEAGWAVELGRPGVSTGFADVEKVAMCLAKYRVEFVKPNPVSLLIEHETGQFTGDNPWNLSPDRIRRIRSLSATIEFKTPKEKVPAILQALKEISGEIDTVFSVGLISRWKGGQPELMPLVKGTSGIQVHNNGKHNVGIGRRGYE